MNYTDEDRRIQWTEFAQIASVEIHETELLLQLEKLGLDYMRERHPQLFSIMRQRFPAVYDTLSNAGSLGVTRLFCIALNQQRASSFKRSVDDALLPQAPSAKQKACAALISMVEADPRIYVCLHVDFIDPCQRLEVPQEQCVDIPQGYAHASSSFLANPAAGFCRIFDQPKCKGDALYIASGTRRFIPKFDVDWNDRAASIMCTDFDPNANHQPTTLDCDEIDELTIIFKLGSKGTSDKLDFVVGTAQIFLVSDPKPYQQIVKPVDVKKTFNALTLPFKTLSWIGIASTGQTFLPPNFKMGDLSSEVVWYTNPRPADWRKRRNSDAELESGGTKDGTKGGHDEHRYG
ncbi:hypothetical protein VFPFJ_01656 [Purpureocillium lilacinum]|uniref:Uncharacterized protein n=1 Tax=Purpureocillium lilacinum TaxID=33203 RepID=A0A179HYD2_PURLI|nr:hypothetical protein VFPFJ_01656 [Purpureocillium lilacinum]OAQ95546.1 hypothetical protein VFPFJ_01656 [Purpureocillium lilacinum]